MEELYIWSNYITNECQPHHSQIAYIKSRYQKQFNNYHYYRDQKWKLITTQGMCLKMIARLLRLIKKPIKTKQNLIKDDRILNKIWLKVSTHIQRLGTTHAPNPPVWGSCCLWRTISVVVLWLFIFLRIMILCQIPIIHEFCKSID